MLRDHEDNFPTGPVDMLDMPPDRPTIRVAVVHQIYHAQFSDGGTIPVAAPTLREAIDRAEALYPALRVVGVWEDPL